MNHLVIARLKNSRTPRVGGFLFHNAFLCFTSRPSSSSSASSTNPNNPFSLSTLISSCGMSPHMSLKLSQRLRSKNPDRPNAVIETLRNHGFSQTQLSLLLKRLPIILLSKPDKTLLPKLHFLHSVGVSNHDLPGILIGNTSLLTASLKNSIIPRYEIVRSLVCSDEELVKTLRHLAWHFHSSEVMKDAVPNVEALRRLGLPQTSVSLLVTNFPRVAFTKHSKFVEAVEKVKEMGFDPLKTNFVLALQVLAKMKAAMWESKLAIFERWGWSRDLCLSAFKRYPQFMLISEAKVMRTMSFLVKDKGFSSVEIARCPGILNRNMERTFVPRCAVIDVLKSRGLVKNGLNISSFITLSEKKFLKRYVMKYQEAVPHLLDVYKGQKSN